jgi:hypothetical protein
MPIISKVIQVEPKNKPTELYIPEKGEFIVVKAMSAAGPGRMDVIGSVVWAVGLEEERIIDSWCGDKSVVYGREYRNEFEFKGDGVKSLSVEFNNDSALVTCFMGITIVFDSFTPK